MKMRVIGFMAVFALCLLDSQPAEARNGICSWDGQPIKIPLLGGPTPMTPIPSAPPPDDHAGACTWRCTNPPFTGTGGHLTYDACNAECNQALRGCRNNGMAHPIIPEPPIPM